MAGTGSAGVSGPRSGLRTALCASAAFLALAGPPVHLAGRRFIDESIAEPLPYRNALLRAAHRTAVGGESAMHGGIRPAQLPKDLPTFSGRDAELAGMRASLRDRDYMGDVDWATR
ncbi:hypothetical protein [Umezawaea sp. NPDC059074]|uniref:hypothetical protein n=1 Tax=Umezawaea sp. NPDC059074 TaxID=3346716 RepID=UPI003691A55A